MAAALKLLIGGPALIYVAGFAIVTILLETFVRYSRYVSVLKWLTLSLFAYVATLFIVAIPWARVGLQLVVPHISYTKDYVVAIVAVFGTTISPYLFFWQSEEEVEDVLERPAASPLRIAPAQAPLELRRIRLDTYVGMAFSNIIALCIVVTAAATLNAHGKTDIETSSQAAEALRPIAGQFAFATFALGIIGTGLLSVPVLAGSAAYALGEASLWPVGLAQRPRRAKAFYATIAIATGIGVVLNFSHLDPVKALFWSAVVNGVAAAPIMAAIMLIASRKDVMGTFGLSMPLRIAGWLATAVMGAATIGMFASMLP
jgi:Mn2+/Fe2+ NRAMP family transporter